MARRVDGTSGGSTKASQKGRVQDGHLPVNELLFSRPGGASPFGEDVVFPLPVEQLSYVHPERQPARER